jgi:hypothetical protein
MFPETAGRTLEEVEDVFNQGHVFSARRIKRDVGKKTLQAVRAAEGNVKGHRTVSDSALPSALDRWLTNVQEHDDHEGSDEHHEKSERRTAFFSMSKNKYPKFHETPKGCKHRWSPITSL